MSTPLSVFNVSVPGGESYMDYQLYPNIFSPSTPPKGMDATPTYGISLLVDLVMDQEPESLKMARQVLRDDKGEFFGPDFVRIRSQRPPLLGLYSTKEQLTVRQVGRYFHEIREEAAACNLNLNAVLAHVPKLLQVETYDLSPEALQKTKRDTVRGLGLVSVTFNREHLEGVLGEVLDPLNWSRYRNFSKREV